MKSYFLFLLLRIFTGSPLTALIGVVIIYALADKLYLGFLPDFGKAFRRSNKIKSNKRALELNPQNSQAALTLGMMYVEKKKYEQGLKYLNHPKLKDNETPNYLYYKGISYMETDDFKKGDEYIKKALKLNPSVGYGLPYIYLLKNELYKKDKDIKVIEKLEADVERFANTENLYKMGLIYKNLGMKDRANKLFTMAINEYSYCPKGVRRLHRKWAFLSRLKKII